MRSRTSASQACGSTSLSLAVSMRVPGSASTFLTHFFGGGLADQQLYEDIGPSAQLVGDCEGDTGNGRCAKCAFPVERGTFVVVGAGPDRAGLLGQFSICEQVGKMIPPRSWRLFLGSGMEEVRSPQHIPMLSIGVQGRHQVLVLLPGAPRARFRKIAQRHRFGLHPEADFGVDVGGIGGGMAEPGTHGVDVDAGEDQVTGGRMHYRSGYFDGVDGGLHNG